MSIPLVSTQGLFTRLGQFIGGSNEAQTAVNATLTARLAAVMAQYTTTDLAVVNNLFINASSYASSPQGWLSNLQTYMQNTTIQMAQDDGIGINPQTLSVALTKLIGQMNSSLNYIQRPVTSLVITNHLTTGNGVFVASLTDYDGLPLDYCLPETITITCTADGYPNASPSATSGSEPFQAVGEVAAPSIFTYNYPQGSGANQQITTFNAALTSGTIITDGSFELWSGSPIALVNWTVIAGVSGTSIVRDGSVPYVGTYDMSWVGDASTLNSLRQAVTLNPNTVYAVCVYMKINNVSAPGAGSVRIRLMDGTSTINDDQGTANLFSTAFTALTTSYVAYTGFFRTPSLLPSNVFIEIANITAALANSRTAFIDMLGMVPATQAYSGGPWTAIFAGDVNFAFGDYFSLAVANSASSTWFTQQLQRYFGLSQLGLKIPSSFTSTISNSLIN